jgi:hypothetical protein
MRWRARLTRFHEDELGRQPSFTCNFLSWQQFEGGSKEVDPMMLKVAIAAAATLGAVALAPGVASAAMPNGLAGAATAAGSQAANIDQVRYVCNEWGRCWWRPNYYGAYGYYGPRPYYGPRVYGGPRFYGRPGWHGGRRW